MFATEARAVLGIISIYAGSTSAAIFVQVSRWRGRTGRSDERLARLLGIFPDWSDVEASLGRDTEILAEVFLQTLCERT